MSCRRLILSYNQRNDDEICDNIERMGCERGAYTDALAIVQQSTRGFRPRSQRGSGSTLQIAVGMSASGTKRTIQPLTAAMALMPVSCSLLSLGADMRRRELITLLGGLAAWPFIRFMPEADIQGVEVKEGDPLYRINAKPFEVELQESEVGS